MRPDQHKLSVQQREEMKDLYTSGTLVKKLSEKFCLSIPCVIRNLNGMGVKTNGARLEKTEDYKFDENVFDNINEESAYWAGFLMADGCVWIRNGIPNSVILKLAEADKRHLEKFCDFIKADRRRIKTHRAYVKGSEGKYSYSILQVCSRKLVYDLSKYGVTPNKSGREIACESLKTNRHFWRGIIDGDGSISIKPDNRKYNCYNHITLCGSETIVNQFKDFVSAFYENNVHSYMHKTENIWYVAFVGWGAYFTVKNLYSDSTIYLDRKFEKAKELMGLFKSADSADCIKEIENEPTEHYPQEKGDQGFEDRKNYEAGVDIY